MASGVMTGEAGSDAITHPPPSVAGWSFEREFYALWAYTPIKMTPKWNSGASPDAKTASNSVLLHELLRSAIWSWDLISRISPD